MATWWENIQIKKGPGGCGDVTEDEKNETIEHAVSTWERMGLSDDEIAFGIGVMGIESGFNTSAEGVNSKTEAGIGQFTKPTWGDAVNYYNTRPEHKGRHEPDIDPAKGRDDPHSQIAVMGPWIRKSWERVATIPGRRMPKGYSFDEVAYGKWHGGQNKTPEDINKFLGGSGYNNPEMQGYFIRNVDRARQALSMRRSARQVGGQTQP